MHCFTDWAAESGQATVEAAFALPILFAMFALVLQPTVLLYDRCVMESAAAETCRLAALDSCSQSATRGFALRRLAAIPRLDLFHTQGCQWDVSVEGGSGQGSVTIRGHVKTLPLLGISAFTMTEPAGDGCALLSVSSSSTLYPGWVADAEGSPEEWISQWE